MRSSKRDARLLRWLPPAMLLLFAGISVADPLRHETYIWQRAWTDPVRAAIAEASPKIDGFCALGGEVSWQQGHPHVLHVPVDWPALRRAGKPFGVALRIGAYNGPFTATGEVTQALADLAAMLVKEAGQPMELQLDFDCAASKLDGYRVWVAALRQRIAPVPLVVTVLPSWMDSKGFVPLVRAASGFVLQVHSLERPVGSDVPLTLCDADAARRWVERATQYGVPFRVALPTYGYLVAFDGGGKFLGLSAEGPSKAWPTNAVLRTVRADAPALAKLVQEWTRHRPEKLTGVIWYRLPTTGDTLNWRWLTLAEILAGRLPAANITVSAATAEGVIELQARNTGTADGAFPKEVSVEWSDVALVAADAVGGYERLDSARGKFMLRANPLLESYRLAPGEVRVIGWLRLSKAAEVAIHVTPHL